MDLLFSIWVLKIEVLLLFISFFYIVYYFFDKLIWVYKFFKDVFKPVEVEKRVSVVWNDLSQNNEDFSEIRKDLSNEDKEKMKTILSQIRLNKARGEYDLAKNSVIEGLLIDKFDKNINMELASLYLMDNDFEKAEIIYKDILLVHNDDFEILKNLWFVLSNQEKYSLWIEVYKKAHNINAKDLEIVNMLAHLYFYEWNYEQSIVFLKKYLKAFPKDWENLYYLWECYEYLNDYKNAYLTYEKLYNFEPYNSKVKEKLEKSKQIINSN